MCVCVCVRCVYVWERARARVVDVCTCVRARGRLVVWSARDVAAICIVNVVGQQQQQQQEHQQHQQQQRNGAVSILVDVRNCINRPCRPWSAVYTMRFNAARGPLDRRHVQWVWWVCPYCRSGSDPRKRGSQAPRSLCYSQCLHESRGDTRTAFGIVAIVASGWRHDVVVASPRDAMRCVARPRHGERHAERRPRWIRPLSNHAAFARGPAFFL